MKGEKLERKNLFLTRMTAIVLGANVIFLQCAYTSHEWVAIFPATVVLLQFFAMGCDILAE